MGRQIGLMTAVMVLLAAGNVRATIIELPLDCAGTYSFNDSWETDFDLEVEFTQIDSVSIEWSGEFNGGRAVYYSAPNDPFPIDVGISADFGRNPTFRSTDVYGGKQTYPNPELFDLTSEVILYSASWSDLYDGKGKLNLYYTQPSLYEGYVIETGTVILNNATIIVDGTLVPEPSAMIIMVLGTLSLVRRRKKPA